MAYGTRQTSLGHTITTYWPDDNDREMYIVSSSQQSLAAIITMAKEKWPGVEPENMLLESERIQTDCLGYDLYDPDDYTDFIVIRLAADS